MTRPQLPPATLGQTVGPVEAAELLDVDERSVRRWADSGYLPVAWQTAGGHRRFRRVTVMALKAARDQGSAEE